MKTDYLGIYLGITTDRNGEEYEDPHLGCPGYPECDEEMSESCCVEKGDDVEWIGHRTKED